MHLSEKRGLNRENKSKNPPKAVKQSATAGVAPGIIAKPESNELNRDHVIPSALGGNRSPHFYW